MRSKSCSLEEHGEEEHGEEEQEEEMLEEVTDRKLKLQREEKGGKLKAELPELSRKQLLHLLGVMEGEVQVLRLRPRLGSALFSFIMVQSGGCQSITCCWGCGYFRDGCRSPTPFFKPMQNEGNGFPCWCD